MTPVRVYDVVRLRRNPDSAEATDVGKDFELTDAGVTRSLGELDDPRVNLYSFDFDQDLVAFVEAEESGDLAAQPFMYMAQRKLAKRVLTLSIETFLGLYSDPTTPERFLHLYSVGRCGSTLLHHALNQVEGVGCLSEPDVFYQLALGVRNALLTSERAVRLAGASLRCLWRSRPAGSRVLAIKHRGKGIWAFREFRDAGPGARVVFLYRNPVDTVQSFDRAANYPHGRRQWLSRVPILASISRQSYRTTALRYGVDRYREHLTTGTPAEVVSQCGVAGYLLLDWISKMDCYLQLREIDPDCVALRYEDLVAAPETMLEALLAACSLSAGDLSRLAAVFARDSQTGTALERSGSNSYPLNPKTISRIHAIVSQQTRLPSDGILPGTLRVR